MKKHISLEKLTEIVQKLTGGIGDVGLRVLEDEFNKLTTAYVPVAPKKVVKKK